VQTKLQRLLGSCNKYRPVSFDQQSDPSVDHAM